MKSIQLFSTESNDLNLAVFQLKQQLDEFSLLQNTCALVFCGYEFDTEKLVTLLNETFGFPFVGCTGLGIMKNDGYCQTTISMTVMTADDVFFEVGMTSFISDFSELNEIKTLFRRLSCKLPYKEKIIFTYTPWMANIISDSVTELLDSESGGVPVYGGIASDNWSFKDCKVFTNEGSSMNRVALLLITGNIHPIVLTENSSYNSDIAKSRKVTKAQGVTVYELDDKPIADFIRANGINTNKTHVGIDYFATPFLTTKQTYDGDSYDVIRNLYTINHDTASCSFTGIVKEGNDLMMVQVSKDSIRDGVSKLFDKLFGMIEKSDKKYSTIICSSCTSRHTLIASDKQSETDGYVGRIPEGINLQGIYVYGEFCPISGKKTGNLYNDLNNETFTLIAL